MPLNLNKLAAAFASIAAIFVTLNSACCVAEQCSTYGDVRLVGGSGQWEGNVQVCMNNTWGYVCDNSWNTIEARGVCYRLGYSYSSSYVSTRSNSYFGSGDGTVHLDNLQCYSYATKLVNCNRGIISCNPYKDIAGVVCRGRGSCTTGEVRLTANSISYGRSSGRVEVCQNSQWGTVCRNPSWGDNNTEVVCRQLGYHGDNSYTYNYIPYGFGSTNVPIRLRNVDCEGDESRLLDCSKVSGGAGCSHSTDAGVRCSSKDTSSCTNGALRLWSAYNDTKPNEGMVQICKYGRWYSMCDYYSSCHIGRVVCQSLGYSGAVTLRSNAGRFYGFYDNVDSYRYYCSSTHTSISQCSYYYAYWGCSSSYSDSLGVMCSTANSQEVTPVNECNNGDVRLVNGTTTNEGRVEYCYKGLWSPACSLSSNTAKLVCKKLGYKHYNFISVDSTGKFGMSKTASVFRSLNCFLSYTNLSQCQVQTSSSSGCYISTPTACSPQYGLTCFVSTENCTSGDVRLVGGQIEQEGRPEVCVDGAWGSICDNGWGTVDAYVFCKTLGHEGPSPNIYYNARFGQAFSVWSYLYCRGWESNVTQCSKSQYSSCPISETAGVRCRDKCISGDVRLVGGQSPDEGTVQVCYNNLWGQVSGAGWTDKDAMVVCRYLGYDSRDATVASYSKYNLAIHHEAVNCQGTEYSLSECSKRSNSISIGISKLRTIESVAGVDCVYNAPTTPSCISATPTGPLCSDSGSFRLVDAKGVTSTDEGRVEYCNGQYWTPLCTMDNRAAQVACRQLGHSQYPWGSVLDSGHDYGTLQSYSLVTNISCAGGETSLSDCIINDAPTDCLPLCTDRNIGLKCFSATNECDDGAVRLVDGILEHEGRVEICLNGVWGTVCDDQWDRTDGHVFCQQLGHPVAEAHVFTHSRFGGGIYPIVYSGVNCHGWESSLSQCELNGFRDTTCSRGRLAGVLCGYNCSDGDVRLVDGPQPYEGTVEVCFSSVWGLVDESGWSLNDAKVVCNQLGYGANADDEIKPRSGSYYGKSNKTVHLSGLECDGTESSLVDCIQTTYSLEEGKSRISSIEVAGVRCSVPSGCEAPPTDGDQCQDGDLRLSGIRNEEDAAGRLEYCHKGYWSGLCGLNDKEALVACRQLGYFKTQYASIFTSRQFSGDLQTESITSYIENITCSTEKQREFSQCQIIDGCQQTCRNPIEIKCFGPVIGNTDSGCEDGSVRLTNGQNTGEGTVEICYNNVWGSVCGSNFDFEAATVTCNQLGIEGGRPVFTTNSSFSNGGQQPILISDVKCTGLEDKLGDCQKSTYLNFDCSRKNLAGVKCKDDCGENRVRLVGGQSLSEGTVEVCYNGAWGLIASVGWTDQDAAVVCAQLGYANQGVVSVTDSRYGETDRSIIFSEVDCSGSESSIFECDRDVIDFSENLRRFVNVSGVSCLGGTPQIGRQTGDNGDKESSMMIAMVFLVICLAIAIIIIISILLIVWLKKRSSKSPELSVSSHAHSSLPSVTMSSVNPMSGDEEFTKDSITESPSFDEKILQL